MRKELVFRTFAHVVAPGTRSDHNAAIVSNLVHFEFDKLPEDILEAIDYVKGNVNARCGEGAKREAYLADLAERLSPDAADSARNRLDEAIAYAEKLFREDKVISKEDFEKRDVQKSLLARELNAGNPVKPVGDYQLPQSKTGDVKKCVVSAAKRQTKSLFMRDLYGKVNKRDWFK